MEQINYLENDGYKVVQMWECDWNETKKGLSNRLDLETQAVHQTINPRMFFSVVEQKVSKHIINAARQKTYIILI